MAFAYEYAGSPALGRRAFGGFFFEAPDARLVAGPPARQLGGRYLRLVCGDHAVGERYHPEDQKELAKALPRAHDRIAEEEERNPLELLPVSPEDLQDPSRFRVEGLDQHERHEGKDPDRQRR